MNKYFVTAVRRLKYRYIFKYVLSFKIHLLPLYNGISEYYNREVE